MHVRCSPIYFLSSFLLFVLFCPLPLFVQVARGSVIITIVVTDNTDRTGANVTLLIIQMEQDVRVSLLPTGVVVCNLIFVVLQLIPLLPIVSISPQYKKGTLQMPLNDGTMRPTDTFVYGPHNSGLHHAPLLFGIVGGVGFLLVALIVVVLVVVSQHTCTLQFCSIDQSHTPC